MKIGFYEELDLLRAEYPDADFGFLENVMVADNRNAMNFLHGFCDEFAASLSDIFGYEIECIRHFDEDDVVGKLIHVYCVAEIHGETAYIDVRGITTDPELFFEEFENEVTYYAHDDELWDLDGPAVVERWPCKDELFAGDYEGWSDESICQFILSNAGYYNVAALERKESLDSKIVQASFRTAGSHAWNNGKQSQYEK